MGGIVQVVQGAEYSVELTTDDRVRDELHRAEWTEDNRKRFQPHNKRFTCL